MKNACLKTLTTRTSYAAIYICESVGYSLPVRVVKFTVYRVGTE